MTHRRAMAIRRSEEWAIGLNPQLDARTAGVVTTMYSAKKGGCSCRDLRDYITELYHLGRDVAPPAYESAYAEVTSTYAKRSISLRLTKTEVERIAIFVGSNEKKEIAKAIAAFVRAGYDTCRGQINCNGERQGIYI